MKRKLLSLAACATMLCGCSTTTTTAPDGTKTVIHKLDADSTAAVSAAVLEALNNPAVQSAISNAVAPK